MKTKCKSARFLVHEKTETLSVREVEKCRSADAQKYNRKDVNRVYSL